MKQPGFIWKVYALYWTILVVGRNVNIFSPDSERYLFYHVLGAFHHSFFVLYYINVVNSVLNVVSLVPLYLFCFGRKIFPDSLWRTLFVLRVGFDVCGNYYDLVSIKSLFATDVGLALQVLLGGIFTTIPSYAACYLYAFDKKNRTDVSDH